MAPHATLYGRQFQVSGWGTLHNGSVPNSLQVANVTVLSKKICEQRVSRLSNIETRGEERLICTIAHPYVLVRPVSNHLYINIVFMKEQFITNSLT
jgi:hypothetical protein